MTRDEAGRMAIRMLIDAGGEVPARLVPFITNAVLAGAAAERERCARLFDGGGDEDLVSATEAAAMIRKDGEGL